MSLRKSRHRERLLLAMASMGECYIGELARHLKLPRAVIRALLHGKPPYYRIELSLVRLGLVREVRRDRSRGYAITSLGLRKARSIVASRGRRRT